MSAARFTPGPWVAMWNNAEIEAAGCQVAHVVSGESREADAALIAAAPDLYAALEAAVRALETEFDHGSEVVERAKAALRKARGEA